MRYTDPLDDLFGSRAKVRILRFLTGSPSEHSGREIARRIGMGETPTSIALKSLADTLVVTYRSDGHTHWYRLNRSYDLVRDMVIPLFEAEAGYLDRAVGLLLDGLEERIQCAIVFGSAAREHEIWASDLDLLLLLSSDEEAAQARSILAERDIPFLARYGVVSPQVMTVREAAARLGSGEPWIAEALRHGVVVRGSLPPGPDLEPAA